jgi:pimeloyl-ACP methyl ester carboxylesterase
MEAIANDVRDVMAAAGAEKVHFVGESTGGTVGLHLAAHRPECLSSLTMVSAAHRGGSIGRARQLRDDVAALGMDRWSETLMPLRFRTGSISAPMWRWFHDVQRSSAPHACVDLVDMLVRVDLTDRLPEIATPTLIIAPDDSPFVSVESALERKRAMPNAKLQVIAGARHGVAFSHGSECAGVWRRLLG